MNTSLKSLHLGRNILTSVLVSLFALAALADEVAGDAKLFLTKYIETYHAFDPAVADLYSDEAVIANTRTYPTGEVRKLTLSAQQYKALLRQTISIAKQRGDRSQYTEPTFTNQGERVRIQMTRYSELKNYSSPMELVVGKDKSGRWVVLEEHTASVP